MIINTFLYIFHNYCKMSSFRVKTKAFYVCLKFLHLVSFNVIVKRKFVIFWLKENGNFYRIF